MVADPDQVVGRAVARCEERRFHDREIGRREHRAVRGRVARVAAVVVERRRTVVDERRVEPVAVHSTGWASPGAAMICTLVVASGATARTSAARASSVNATGLLGFDCTTTLNPPDASRVN